MQSNNAHAKRLIGAITFVLAFFVFSRPPVDADLWWHLRAGQTMWAEKVVLLRDSFSYTQLGAPWVNAFWFSEVCLYLLYRWGGTLALATFVSVTGAITFQFIYRRLPGNHIINSFIIILAALTAAPIWGPRPQIISFFIIAWLDTWLAGNGKSRPKWILVPLFALWANIHGGWIWGILLLAAEVAGRLIQLATERSTETRAFIFRETRSLVGWSILAGMALGINPNGISIWRLPFQQINVSLQIQEWLSPDFHRIDFHPLLWMMFLLIALAPFARKPPSWSRLFKVLGFAYLTFVAQRNIALFAIVTVPLLASWANEVWDNLAKIRSSIRAGTLDPRLAKVVNFLLVVSLSLASLGYLFSISRPANVEKHYPSGAVEWMRTNKPPGNLLNSYNWGGYIVWSLPEYPVFIDGRADMYGSEIITQWHEIVNARENAFSILDAWGIKTVLLEPGWPIIASLQREGWGIAYQDEKSIILIRK